MNISICILTFNSEKTIDRLLKQIDKIGCEVIIVDSGSTDNTVNIIKKYSNIKLYFKEYKHHSLQMNYATSLAKNDWVLCLDSDEIPNDYFIESFINLLKNFDYKNSKKVGRIKRNWIVLGKPVHAMYPCSSPDYITRFYNKKRCFFNDSVVDDKVLGFKEGIDDFILQGDIMHYTFETKDIMNKKLKTYVERSKSKIRNKSKIRGIVSAFGAFIKWYFVKKSFLDGVVGIHTTLYAIKYSYYKYQ